MTGAQLQALLAGPYAPVRANAHRLAQNLELRRLARTLKRTHHDVIGRLMLVWGWQAARWTPDDAWGGGVPCAVVDALLGSRSACSAMVGVGLGNVVIVGSEPVLRLLAIDGAPDVRTRYSWAARGVKGRRTQAERSRANVASG